MHTNIYIYITIIFFKISHKFERKLKEFMGGGGHWGEEKEQGKDVIITPKIKIHSILKNKLKRKL